MAMNASGIRSESANRTARTAGLLYLVVVVTGMFSLAYVPSQIAMSGEPSTVVQNLAASETLFRSGIAAAVVCYIAFLLLPIALYRLLGTVATTIAVMAVAASACRRVRESERAVSGIRNIVTCQRPGKCLNRCSVAWQSATKSFGSVFAHEKSRTKRLWNAQ